MPRSAPVVRPRRIRDRTALARLIGFTNDWFQASPDNPAGYAPGRWIFTALASLGLSFSFMLSRTEKGPGRHGLETITTKTGAG